MGQLLVPALIGAGVGAVGGAVSGKNPFKSALLGGALGAGGAGLMGGAGGIGAGGAAATGAGTAGEIGGLNLIGSGVAGGTAGLGTAATQIMPSIYATPSVYGGGAASSLLDQTGAFLSNNIGNPFTNMSTMDKINLGAKGFDALNQPQQQMQVPPVIPITRGNPEMVSSPLSNVAPNVGLQQGNDRGMPNLMTRMPLTEEELLRLQQQLQTTGYRGR
jgi:hypothetical protein